MKTCVGGEKGKHMTIFEHETCKAVSYQQNQELASSWMLQMIDKTNRVLRSKTHEA